MTSRLDFKIGCFFLTLSLFVIVIMVPTINEDWREASSTGIEMFTIGPRFFPYLAALVIGILAMALIVGNIRKISDNEAGQTYFTTEELKHVFVFIVIGIIYIILLQMIGVMIATPLCLLSFFIYFEVRSWPWMIGLSLGTTIVIYLSFAKLMMVPLPMGFLE